MTVGLSTTAIFGDLGGYCFGNFRPAILYSDCRPVIDCKMNDLGWLFRVKIRFRPALLD